MVLIALAAQGSATAVSRHRKRDRAIRTDEAPVSPAQAYLGSLGITMLNPTTVIYFTALVLGSRIAAAPKEQAGFVLAAFTASASWQLLLAGGGALLGQALTGSRGRLITAIASSLLITGLAIHLLISAP